MMSRSTENRRDIIISIHPEHVANIVNRVKNHEFRNYLLPISVERLWIYETSPLSSIRFVATISHGKRPGEIRNPTGLRNDEFDRGDLEGRAKYAYEILKLEQLPTSYSLADLKTNGWLNGAPQKYCFLKPSMREVTSSLPLHLVFGPASMLSQDDAAAESTLSIARVPKKLPLQNRPLESISKPTVKQSSKKQKERQASLQHWFQKKIPTSLNTTEHP